MKAAELRQSILQMAVRGKLVPQDLHDEPASELLEHIHKGKAQLIKEGKIKKEKPLPPIAEDDIPYDLPEGWVWCRLGDLTCFLGGCAFQSKDYVKSSNNQIIRIGNVKNHILSLESSPVFISDQNANKSSQYRIECNDILFTMTGTRGKRDYFYTYLVNANDLSNKHLYLNQRVGCLRVYKAGTELLLCMFLKSPVILGQIFSTETGTANQGNIGSTSTMSLLFPLPPLAEQQRIVAKVDELMALCDELEVAENELETLENHFIEYLPKSILQMAVQGKLAPQDLHDEPATELLERIRKEKVQLIKEGKIKKEKPLPPIAKGEAPYDLPEGWVWCRLGDVCSYIQRGKSPKYSKLQQVPILSQKCVQWAGIDMSKARFIDPDTLSGYANERFLQNNDILWNSTGQGTLGRVMRYPNSVNPYDCAVVDSHVTIVRLFTCEIIPEYAFSWLSAPEVQDNIEEKAAGTTKQIELATETIKNHLIPLPPLAEQQRIVAKVHELMALCDQLKEAKTAPVVHSSEPHSIPFPEKREDEPLLMVAQGAPSQEQSQELRQAIDDLFGDDEDE